MATKSVIESKSIWFNGLSIAGLVLTELLASPSFRDEYGGNLIYIMILGALANVLIRFNTTKPLNPLRKRKRKLNPVDQALLDEANENGMV